MLHCCRSGGAGAITATTNLVARDLRFVFDHWADPSKVAAVEAAQARVVAYRELSNSYARLPTLKAMTAHRTGQEIGGVGCGRHWSLDAARTVNCSAGAVREPARPEGRRVTAANILQDLNRAKRVEGRPASPIQTVALN